MQEPDEVDPAIRRALVALAEDDAGSGTCVGVEDRLREAVRSIARSRRRRVHLWSIGMAATVLLAAGLTRPRGAPHELMLPTGAPTGIAAPEVSAH